MSTRVNAANRTVLTVLGLFLLAAGVVGLIVSLGGYGAARSTGPVLPEQVRSFAAEQPWFWWAVAAGCGVVALLALRWLLAQLSTDRVGHLDLTEDDREGLTTLHAGAVTAAVEAEVRAVRGVSGASAHLRGQGRQRLALTVDLTDRADIAEVRRHLEEETVPHLRQALDDPAFGVEIELRPGARESTRDLR